MKKTLFFFVALVSMAFMISCASERSDSSDTTATSNESKTTAQTTSPRSIGEAVAQNNANAQAPAEEVPAGPVTSIEFNEPTFDYGEINEGEVVKHTYTFTNTGNEPLIISNAKGTCGCTVPTWPKQPIAPGESGEIPVEFNSKGKSGPQSKRVIVTANTNPPKTTLTIKGSVIKESEPAVNNG